MKKKNYFSIIFLLFTFDFVCFPFFQVKSDFGLVASLLGKSFFCPAASLFPLETQM